MSSELSIYEAGQLHRPTVLGSIQHCVTAIGPANFAEKADYAVHIIESHLDDETLSDNLVVAYEHASVIMRHLCEQAFKSKYHHQTLCRRAGQLAVVMDSALVSESPHGKPINKVETVCQS